MDAGPTAEEMVRDAFPGAQTVSGNVIQLPAAPPHGGDWKDWTKAQKDENAQWAKERLSFAPDEFWDNRDDKASGKVPSNRPDYKHKESGIGVYVS
jgi:hypothetical protein